MRKRKRLRGVVGEEVVMVTMTMTMRRRKRMKTKTMEGVSDGTVTTGVRQLLRKVH